MRRSTTAPPVLGVRTIFSDCIAVAKAAVLVTARAALSVSVYISSGASAPMVMRNSLPLSVIAKSSPGAERASRSTRSPPGNVMTGSGSGQLTSHSRAARTSIGTFPTSGTQYA